jgi:DnaJ-class molecular chaperone
MGGYKMLTIPNSDIAPIRIPIQKGWKDGMNLIHTTKDTKINITLKQIPNEMFERHGNDLVAVKKIGLLNALTGFVLEIKTLDKRVLTIPVTQVVWYVILKVFTTSPGFEKTVVGEGMPTENGKGNLILRFDVEYPTYFTEDQKAHLSAAFEK